MFPFVVSPTDIFSSFGLVLLLHVPFSDKIIVLLHLKLKNTHTERSEEVKIMYICNTQLTTVTMFPH